MTEQINHAINWAVDNWAIVCALAVLALQILNKFTERWDEGQKGTATRFALVVTELLSVLTSRGWKTPAGPLKPPLTLRSGKRGSLPAKAPPVSLLLMIGGALVMPTTQGCSAAWRAGADKSIQAAYKTARGGWDTARRILHAQCLEAGRECVNDNWTGKMEDCPPIAKCRARASNVMTAYMGTQEMIALAGEALRKYDIAVAVTSNAVNEDDEVDPQLKELKRHDKKEISRTKAETQERIYRAERATLNLMRKLNTEGLTDASE